MSESQPKATPGASVTASGVGHAKVIVSGEHFVLDGATALSLALPSLTTEVALTSGSRGIDIETSEPLNPSQLAQTRKMLTNAAKRIGFPPHFTARIKTTIPIGRGLGSSAAFAVASCTAIAQLAECALTDKALLQHCRAVEDVVHGQSSGLDPAAAMRAGGVLFQNSEVVERVTIHATAEVRAARWVIADAGHAPSTSTAILAANRARLSMGASALRVLIERVDEASRTAATALSRGQLQPVTEAMQVCGDALARLNVVDARMQTAIENARTAGALAIKQTGAGMGGAMLALAPDSVIAQRVREALLQSCQRVWIASLA